MNYSIVNVALLDKNLFKCGANVGEGGVIKEILGGEGLKITGLHILDANVWLQIQSL